MKALRDDLLREYSELADRAEALSPGQWQISTPFYGWSPYDEIAHLCLFDELAVVAITDLREFRRQQAALDANIADGKPISEIARERFAGISGKDLNHLWRTLHTRVCDLLATADAKARVPWFGPDMSARSFATARLMETWAHGQDIYDALRLRRPVSARLRHIAHLGVFTFGWSFRNRGLPLPSAPPLVELSGAEGEIWRWNEASVDEVLRGSAEDFCLVVTQRRHFADTTLQAEGDGTLAWMAIAQCFAGPPADGPAPGDRRIDY